MSGKKVNNATSLDPNKGKNEKRPSTSSDQNEKRLSTTSDKNEKVPDFFSDNKKKRPSTSSDKNGKRQSISSDNSEKRPSVSSDKRPSTSSGTKDKRPSTSSGAPAIKTEQIKAGAKKERLSTTSGKSPGDVFEIVDEEKTGGKRKDSAKSKQSKKSRLTGKGSSEGSSRSESSTDDEAKDTKSVKKISTSTEGSGRPSTESKKTTDTVITIESKPEEKDGNRPSTSVKPETAINVEPEKVTEQPEEKIPEPSTPRKIPSKFIHEREGDVPEKASKPCCLAIRNLFPNEVALSSYPEVIYFTMNIIYFVLATHMEVMALTCSGWSRILYYMRNRKNDRDFFEDYSTLVREHKDLKNLRVSSNVLSVNALILVLFCLVGSIGTYFSQKILQIIHMLGILICIGLQIWASMHLHDFHSKYCKTAEIKQNFDFHISSYYTQYKSNLTHPSASPEFYLSKNLIDGIQDGLDCCGYESYEQYMNLVGVTDEGDYPIPHSCCKSAWRPNIFCNYVLESLDEEYDAKIEAESSCGNAIKGVCDTVSYYVGDLVGFIIAAIMVPPLIVCFFCAQYNWIAYKMLQKREKVTVEKINLLTPLMHDIRHDIDGLPERHLIIDVDQIKLTEELEQYIQELRAQFGLNDMFTKKQHITYNKITEFTALPKFLAPAGTTNRTRKLSFVAGRHNYLLSRGMLGYAAKVVTEQQDLGAYTKLRNLQIRKKVRTLRHYNARKAKEIIRSDATYPWRFHRGADEADKKKELEFLRKRVAQIVQATVESAMKESKDVLEGLSPEEVRKKLEDMEAGHVIRRNPKIDRLRAAMPPSRTGRWVYSLRKALYPTKKLTPYEASRLAQPTRSGVAASTIIPVPPTKPGILSNKKAAGGKSLKGVLKTSKVFPDGPDPSKRAFKATVKIAEAPKQAKITPTETPKVNVTETPKQSKVISKEEQEKPKIAVGFNISDNNDKQDKKPSKLKKDEKEADSSPKPKVRVQISDDHQETKDKRKGQDNSKDSSKKK